MGKDTAEDPSREARAQRHDPMRFVRRPDHQTRQRGARSAVVRRKETESISVCSVYVGWVKTRWAAFFFPRNQGFIQKGTGLRRQFRWGAAGSHRHFVCIIVSFFASAPRRPAWAFAASLHVSTVSSYHSEGQATERLHPFRLRVGTA